MDDKIANKLSEMPAARLIKIIQAAMGTMGETEQIDFIAKYIDARTGLERLGANDPAALIDETEAFCLNCLNGMYYSDEDDIETYFSKKRYDSDDYYDDDWDYDEYYSDTEWADTFGRLFKFSMMFMQSGDFETGYEATSRLLSCLKELGSSESFLGTDEPMSYISTDWNELFSLHYEALFKCRPDTDTAIERAFRLRADFGSCCDEGFLSNVKDAAAAKRIIMEAIRGSNDWAFQRNGFDLLTRLYGRLGEAFDKAAQAGELIEHNVYFYLMVVEGMCEKACWREAIETARTALMTIKPSDTPGNANAARGREIIDAIKSMLADAYEQISDFSMAFETVESMFMEAPSFELYKRARALSEKSDNISSFLSGAEDLLKRKKRQFGFSEGQLLLDIYSYEGEAAKMIAMAASQKIETNYYDRKYIALSLVYRALADTPQGIGVSLTEYISTGSDQDGIFDMRLSKDDGTPQIELLLRGADLLRDIIAFHINVAARNRYAKAAYYMCVIRDIYIYLKLEGDFRCYFQEVIQQNSRRPALRDEMGVVYGAAAVEVKKKRR